MLTLLLATAALAAPDCPADAELAEFQALARKGEQAFAEMDLLGLTRSRDAALAVIPCIQEPVPVPVAADFHRLMAMAAFTGGDEPRVLAEFHASRRLIPGYEVPASVVPVGHPLLDLYAASAEADEGELDSAIPPLGGYVVVDGVRGAPRPRGISTIVQAFDPDGSLVESRYLAAGDPTPAWGPLPLELEQRKRRRTLMASLTGTSLAAAGTLYGLAWASRSHFDDTDPQTGPADNELATLRVRTNAYAASAAAVGVVTLGLGTLTVVTW